MEYLLYLWHALLVTIIWIGGTILLTIVWACIVDAYRYIHRTKN